MKREIKFRAWDGEQMITESLLKEYDTYFILDLSGNFYPHTRTGDSEFEYDQSELNKKQYTLMQFTGLRDKNGVEIYEGDVVVNVGKHPHVIQWNESGFWTAQDSHKNDYGYTGRALFLKHEFPNIEVIGNIYETPDLCKA
jgi:uncharacterized phage protein (TIGR01671 family)